jgi:2-C-methyl-D-erythritol 4-phosphate cytidylyltransferase
VKITAVIVAGGKGTRMGASFNKVFLELCGKPIIAHTVEAFEKNPLIDEIVVVTGKNDIQAATEILRKYSKISAIIEGGNERQQSVSNGINAASGDIIAIHDGARALIGQSEINSVINDCIKYGAAALGVPCKDTLKEADDNGFIRKTIDRSRTYQIQTPQVFKAEIIKELHKKAELDNLQVTDDCAIAEQYGIRVKITEGSYNNLKITTPEDMAVGEIILRRLS